MFRQLTSRRTLKWTGTTACAVCALAFGASAWLHVTGGVNVGNNALRVALDVGEFIAFDIDIHKFAEFAEPTSEQEVKDSYPASCFLNDSRPIEWWDWPMIEIDDYMWRVCIPLWIPFILLAIPTAWLWRLDRRRPRAGCCRKCDYDLTGNVSGRCPECGAEILKGAAARANEAGGGNAAGV